MTRIDADSLVRKYAPPSPADRIKRCREQLAHLVASRQRVERQRADADRLLSAANARYDAERAKAASLVTTARKQRSAAKREHKERLKAIEVQLRHADDEIASVERQIRNIEFSMERDQ